MERERKIVCQNVDVWRLGFQPCQMIKMFPLTFIFPYLDSCLCTSGCIEYEARDGHIECLWLEMQFRHVAFADTGKGFILFY